VDQGSIFYSSFQTSLAADSDGGVHLAYYGSQTKDAKYAKLIYAPTAPRNLVAVPSKSNITLSWDEPLLNGGAEITGYKVYRGGYSPHSDYEYLATTGKTRIYADSGLTYGQEWIYYVTAVNAAGEGPGSNTNGGGVLIDPPTTPTLVSATPAGNGMVTLTWTAPINDGGAPILGYNVYRGTTSGGESFGASTGTSALTYLYQGLPNGYVYYFQVSAAQGPMS